MKYSIACNRHPLLWVNGYIDGLKMLENNKVHVYKILKMRQLLVITKLAKQGLRGWEVFLRVCGGCMYLIR